MGKADETQARNDRRRAEGWRILLILVDAYLLTRFSVFSRELASEEGYFLIPGRSFFETGRFLAYFGEDLLAEGGFSNPFHKPPLASLLLGAFSFLTPDGIAGARLLPMLAVLFVVLLPWFVYGSWAVSALLIFSPFLYAASGHMQTDTTVSLVGYGLFCLGGIGFLRGTRSWRALLFGGLSILWMGKIETACIATFSGGFVPFFAPVERRKEFVVSFIQATGVGVALFVGLTLSLGYLAGFSAGDSVGFVIGTITRISGGLAEKPDRLQSAWLSVRYLERFAVPSLLFLLLGAAFLFRRRVSGSDIAIRRFAWVAFLVPMAVFLLGGYTGDGFPRYYLICLIPAALLGAMAFESRPRAMTLHRGVLALVAIALGVQLVGFAIKWVSRGSVSVRPGEGGYAALVKVADAAIEPDLWLLGPEPMVWYARDRKWLLVDAIEPAPHRHQAAIENAHRLGAAIVPKSYRDRTPIGEIVDGMLQEGAMKIEASEWVLVIRREAMMR